MSEYWVSEGRQWCKYCRKYISSNVNQVRQHELGRNHKEKEEEYIRAISLKANLTTAGAATVTGELLERISLLKKEQADGNVESVAKAAEADLSKGTVPNDDDDDGQYPAPAHEAYGKWVEVSTTEPTVIEVPKEFAPTERKPEDSTPERSSTVRIGALDDDDEAEAKALEQVGKSTKKAKDATWDMLESKLRKRVISKGGKKKRKRSVTTTHPKPC